LLRRDELFVKNVFKKSVNILYFFVLTSFALAVELPKKEKKSVLVQESFHLQTRDIRQLDQLLSESKIILDHVNPKTFEVHGPFGTEKELQKLGLSFHKEELSSHKAGSDYPSSEEVAEHLKSIAQKYPEITQLVSLGKSHRGQDLFMLKISDHAALDEVEPEFLYIANMHGNEIAGRELMIKLIQDILQAYKAGDVDMIQLVNNSEIFIMPSMNPDGADARRRGNAQWVDLNRDFPDFTTFDNKNTVEGRQPETQAIMKFQNERNFALSANFHGGAEVVNYPWDTTAKAHPLEQLIEDLSLSYSKRATYMYESTSFEDGIVNGYDWYEVNGGMQDWSLNWYNNLQVTIELTSDKWPKFSSLESYYQANKSSLLHYMLSIHQGAGIYYHDFEAGDTIRIVERMSKNEILKKRTLLRGEFYAVLKAGEYLFEVHNAQGDLKKVSELTVKSAESLDSQNLEVNYVPAEAPKGIAEKLLSFFR